MKAPWSYLPARRTRPARRLAWLVAVAADVTQFVLFPLFGEGIASVPNDVDADVPRVGGEIDEPSVVVVVRNPVAELLDGLGRVGSDQAPELPEHGARGLRCGGDVGVDLLLAGERCAPRSRRWHGLRG